jgi:hypothetical protein
MAERQDIPNVGKRIDPLRVNRRISAQRNVVLRRNVHGAPEPAPGAPVAPEPAPEVPVVPVAPGAPVAPEVPVAPEPRRQPEESEIFVYIFHGMIDENKDKLDSEEDLEKRQKYIYDLRYWAWKRLNMTSRVEWENVNAYYYNHSSDSIWSKMFSPPIYWSPIETTGKAFGKFTFGALFGKFDFANSELTESNIEIIRKIAEQINDEKTVLLYGFSVGGFVVHRICEILNVCVKNEKLSKLILGVVLEEDDLDYLKVATFGSSYLSPRERVSSIENITNYILIDDVVTRTNLFDFGLGFNVPSFEDNLFTKDDGYIGFIRTTQQAKLYEFMQYYDTNIVYLQKWEKGWWFSEHRVEIEKKNFLEYNVGELKELYNNHNAKYDLLFNKLLKNQITNYLELETIEYTNQPNEIPQAAAAVMAVPVVAAIQANIEVEVPENTVDELVNQGIVRFDNNFYRDQLNYIQDPPRKTRIDNALRLAQEAREELEESMRRRGEQNAQRDARVKRRATIQEVRNEMNDISHHTADSILQLHETQRIPVLIAEEPEQDILDFSLIMAQLETKAMFLEGDGLKSLRAITRAAIDRGKANRDMIPAARNAAAAAAGGGRRRKKEGGSIYKDVLPVESQEGIP